MSNLKFKKGDIVTMKGCHEATMSQYKNKKWTCQTDSFIAKCGDEVVFLEGFSGYFMAKYLIKNSIKKHYIYDVVSSLGEKNIIFNKRKIYEEEFEEKLESKLAELVKDKLERKAEIRIQIDEILSDGKTVTVGDLCFEIKHEKTKST